MSYKNGRQSPCNVPSLEWVQRSSDWIFHDTIDAAGVGNDAATDCAAATSAARATTFVNMNLNDLRR
jgi:hypothetical protein